MSSFRDTFTRGDDDNLVGYDDGASMYFGATMLFCAVAPWTISFVRRFRKKRSGKGPTFRSETPLRERTCKCSLCATRLHTAAEIPASEHRAFWWELFGIIILWTLLFLIGLKLFNAPNTLSAFDPFEILGIAESATTPEIRKAFRRASLKFHPDQNPNDPSAAARFIMISKAHQALTDETARANWEKYGNPDGRSMMKVGIGLPKFLIEPEFQLFILTAFFLVIIVILPLAFLLYYQRTKNFGQNGVRVETVHSMAHHYSTNKDPRLNYPMALSLIAGAAELEDIPMRESDLESLNKVLQELRIQINKKHSAQLTKHLALIVCHLRRKHHLLNDDLQGDLEFILKQSMKLISTMLEIGLKTGNSILVRAVIDLKRCFVQGQEVNDNVRMQIPHIDAAALAKMGQKNGMRENEKAFKDLEKLKKSMKIEDPEKLKDIDAFLSHIPDLELSYEIFVEDEDKIVEGDIATLTVTLTRNNLEEGDAVTAVHAPLFPGTKREEWFVMLMDKRSGILFRFTKTADPRRTVKIEMKFPIQQAGVNDLILFAMCDSYGGVDQHADVKFVALSEAEACREVFTHPEDVALDYEPSLLQQVMGGGEADSSEDEDE